MPSGKIHDRITLWLLPFIVAGSYIFSRDGELTLLCAGGYLVGGLLFGPDLDIHSRHYKRWGILRYFWLPYQKLIPHRSWLSHGFLVGTLLRLLYLLFGGFVVAALVIAIAQVFWDFAWNWQTFLRQQFNFLWQTHPWYTWSFVLGLEMGAMSHYSSDRLSSYFKKTQRKNRRKTKKK